MTVAFFLLYNHYLISRRNEDLLLELIFSRDIVGSGWQPLNHVNRLNNTLKHPGL